MEWVETTGKSIEEAKEAALDELGVAEDDAEFEVLDEPKAGLFGRVRGEARVRARVRPTRPRAKEERRDRKKRPAERTGASSEGQAAAESDIALDGATADASPTTPARAPAASVATGRPGAGRRNGRTERSNDEGTRMDEDVPMAEQGEVAATFLRGLLETLGSDADVTVDAPDDDIVHVGVTGGDLGVLIGPRGSTLQALQDLTRTVVQRRTGGRNGRIVVDVSGYRQKRRAALERFTIDVAAQVRTSGERKVLEPMHPADRKVIHDTANTIDGVTTSSEGEEPRRRVVISPSS